MEKMLIIQFHSIEKSVSSILIVWKKCLSYNFIVWKIAYHTVSQFEKMLTIQFHSFEKMLSYNFIAGEKAHFAVFIHILLVYENAFNSRMFFSYMKIV